jgi:hypothetical protein
MPTRTDEGTFRAADLIGSAGVAANGEKLVATLDYHYSPEQIAAQERPENADLTAALTDEHRAAAADLAGAGRESGFQVMVRGGKRRPSDAWVTYAFIDETGDVVKGAFPYSDLGSTSSDGHVSQRTSIMRSPAARDHLEAQKLKADAAPAAQDSQALRSALAAAEHEREARRAAEAQLAEAQSAPPAGPADPFAAMAGIGARDLVKQMEAHPERAAAIQAFEQATRGDRARASVMNFTPGNAAAAEAQAAAEDAGVA